MITTATQVSDSHSKGHRYNNLVFSLIDDQGEAITDFDLYLLGGPTYDPAGLPKGFFIDRQLNPLSPNCLVYYVDNDIMATVPNGVFGIRVQARPTAKEFAGYAPVEFRTDGTTLSSVLLPNQTLYVEIRLRRRVDSNVFRLDPASGGPIDFKKEKPAGTPVAD